MRRSAFTMLEMVMVIVVLGILAALAIPRMNRDIRQEAADNVLSAIRYTQHLALMDSKVNLNPTPENPKAAWLKTLWHLRFATYTKDGETKWFYTISSNMDHDTNVDKNETAVDMTNGKYFYHLAGDATETREDESLNLFIGKKFGVKTITFTNGCAGGQLIAFDHLGRPHVGIYGGGNDFATYMTNDCTMTFGFEDSTIPNFQILIRAETGYANIVGQNNS